MISHYYYEDRPVKQFSKPCRYCGKLVVFDSRVKSKGGFNIALNDDRSIHNCGLTTYKNKVKNKDKFEKQLDNLVTAFKPLEEIS